MKWRLCKDAPNTNRYKNVYRHYGLLVAIVVVAIVAVVNIAVDIDSIQSCI